MKTFNRLMAIGVIVFLSGCATCSTDPSQQSTACRIFANDEEVLSDMRNTLQALQQRALGIEQKLEEFNAQLFLINRKKASLELSENELKTLNDEIASLEQATADLESLNQQNKASIDVNGRKLASKDAEASELKAAVDSLQKSTASLEQQVKLVGDNFRKSLAMSSFSQD